jgi:membrane associated rhomboid family serine protease
MTLSETPVTLILILLNVIVGIYSVYMDTSLVSRMAFKPARIRNNGEYYRFITAGFVHAGNAHLAFNMLTLYFFGPYLELRLGSSIFALVFLFSLLSAHLLTYVRQRNTESYSAVGASGAISGILFAYCLFNPFSRIGVFFVLWIPAWAFAIAFVGFSLYAMKQQASGNLGRIAHEAHLGGAIGGVVITLLLKPEAWTIFLNQLR